MRDIDLLGETILQSGVSLHNTNADGLDRFDLAILDILQHDNCTPQRIIGERVNLSAAAVNRRIQRMRKDGIIVGNYSAIDPTRIGLSITIIVEVHIESERLDLLDAAKRTFTADPEVQQCYYVTGEADFILIAAVRSMEAYEALTRRLFFENHNVRKFRTLVVMERLKTGVAIPLPDL